MINVIAVVMLNIIITVTIFIMNTGNKIIITIAAEPSELKGAIQPRRRKWTWAGHITTIRDNRWKPYERKRPRGRPARQWRVELGDNWKSTMWQRIAQDRQMWKQHAEAFSQPRDTTTAQ